MFVRSSNDNTICPILSIASAAAGGASTARCRGEGCSWYDMSESGCVLSAVVTALLPLQDRLDVAVQFDEKPKQVESENTAKTNDVEDGAE